MGADAFLVFYGVRETVADDDAAIEALEEGDHPLLSLPRTCGLDSWWGRLTDGSEYHILLGKRVGVFGVENQHDASIDPAGLSVIASEVDALLTKHGISGTPTLHFQLEAQC
ncbi:hypothetical protein RISK_004472 [Rhodopirellula islandica]|uniref:Uncharacterized protein n=1 Tax=Rhodopirellula islandica TaxID=595434 RepID=A0A0J1BAD7_RHOIS|nr:hypothetical protein RISK_004472 [Rhodopirellula islandica]